MAEEPVPADTPMAMIIITAKASVKYTPRFLAKSLPTEETFRQCGHRANALLSVLNCKKTCVNIQLFSLKVSKHYQEVVMTMGADHSAHTGHVGVRNGRLYGTRWSQTDDPFAIGSWTSNSVASVFANQQAVARASDVLATRRRIPDGRGLTARVAFHHMLFSFARNINHSLLKSKTLDTCLYSVLLTGLTWHTRQVTTGVPPVTVV